MAVEIVVGAPFGGKSRYIEDEILRREEEEGELGLVALDFTGLYSATVPGKESVLRDQALADTGAARFAGFLFNAAVSAIAVRELSGYVATPSPIRALELAGRFDGRLVNVAVGIEDLASRIDEHMGAISRKVRRASRGSIERRCKDAAGRYLNEADALVGKARNVRKVGNRWRDDGPVQPFDRDHFRRGLSANGREVVAQLEADGDLDWRPKNVLDRLLLEAGR